MGYDIQVLTHAVLYAIGSLCGFVIVIPIAVCLNELDNNCILFGGMKFSTQGSQSFLYSSHFSSISTCYFPIGVGVSVGMVFGFLLGGYNLFRVISSRDNNIGESMWITPFLFLNALSCVILFAAGVTVSVGFKQFCDSVKDGLRDIDKPVDSCRIAENWKVCTDCDSDGNHLYSLMIASQAAIWAAFLVWVLQVALYAFRFFRSRQNTRSASQSLPNQEVINTNTK